MFLRRVREMYVNRPYSMKPLAPKERYQRDLQREGFVADPAQAAAVDALQRVYDELLANPPKRRLLSQRVQWPPVKGLYLWGSVGRGKTYLVDAFYESLPFTRKLRLHFHRFMLDVHERRRQHANETDPLMKIADDLAAKLRVLCFDEFFVSDIADAMILGRLMEGLFAHGVTLVATSNVEPDQLYRDGLQRDRFLPAIAGIKKNVEVVRLDGPVDYRLRALTHAEIYHHPSDAAAEVNLSRWFGELAPEPGAKNRDMDLNGRPVRARRMAEGVAWFDFAAICEGPRSAADYVELAKTHHSVLISRVPQLTAQDDDAARRFVNLVDEFYDRGVNLILAGAVPLEQLYVGDKLAFEFRRTLSRLKEMQSQEYLARPHLA
jgi:cell division protein ZapE